ncbi:MAG: cytochrome c5 family protein [Moraxellaceae bacterium]|nr:cytochrome c5 family protein [Pseudomonadales bacterium]MCP5175369.1 cytochrome c5 family protein [Moraxellaceae bacterium]MCP5177126.1 cytochrome c5 family protein [Moraxellaceae bacterium]HQV23151.1 c-type cytochrome [Agitococcus sp.]
MHKVLFLSLSVLVLSACGNKASLQPITLSEQQQQLFEQSCKTCHANPANPAPQVGDKAAWDKRLEQGLPTLVQHAIQGFNAMPAGGLCATCTPPDFEAMITYMATAQTQK